MSSLEGERLVDVLDITNFEDFKIHLAQIPKPGPNTKPGAKLDNPLEAFQVSRQRWQRWNDNVPPRVEHEYNRRYIIGMAQWDATRKNKWLFGCVFEVMGTRWTEECCKYIYKDNDRWCYETKVVDPQKGDDPWRRYSGLLVAEFQYLHTHPTFRFDLEEIADELRVIKVLPSKHQDWSW